MKALVVGGSGQIGGWLLHVLRERGHDAVGTYATQPFPDLVAFDSAAPESLTWFRDRRFDVVFYPAGWTWVDGCENDPLRSDAANVDQPLTLAEAGSEHGTRFVYFSTDYVFDGTSGPNAEDDPPRPLSAYGRSKLKAERALPPDALILRTSWVFGPERQGKNFAYQLVRTLGAGRALTCPSDQSSNPSYGPDVARAAVQLVERGASGLYHAAGPQVRGRVDFARTIAKAFDLDDTLIEPKTTAELGQVAPRPLRGGLRIDRLEATSPNLMRPLEDALLDFQRRIADGAGWRDPRA